MIKRILLLLIIFSNCSGQVPTILWEHTYGGGQADEAYSISEDQFNNMWIAGRASSDALVFSIDNSGNQIWRKIFGGTNGNESAEQILRNFDGNIVFAGKASSTDGDVVGLHGGNPFTGGYYDYWVVCLDTSGTILWQNCLGGTYDDECKSIVQTSDSGYIVFGLIGSDDGDINTIYGPNDLWIAKISNNGILQWRKTYGGYDNEIAGKIISTSDRGFIFCSSSKSFDHDVTSNFGAYDAWVVKLSSNGIIQWQRSYGGSADDIGRDIIQGDDGSYFLIGNTSSTDFDIIDPKGQGDIWAMKIDSLGGLLWSKCLGGSQNDAGYAGCITANGVEVVGYTYSNDSTVSGNHGFSDIVAFEIDNNGNNLWSKCLGGSDSEGAYSVVSTSDGGSAISGYTFSSDGDVGTPNAGNEQAWVIRLSPNPVKVIENNFSNSNLRATIKNGLLEINYFSNFNLAGEFSLFDLNGKVIFKKTIQLYSNQNEYSFPVSIPNGFYILHFICKDGSIASKVIAIGN